MKVMYPRDVAVGQHFRYRTDSTIWQRIEWNDPGVPRIGHEQRTLPWFKVVADGEIGKIRWLPPGWGGTILEHVTLMDVYHKARRCYLRMKKRVKSWSAKNPVGRPLDRFHKPDFKSYGIAHWFDALVPRLARALMEASGAKAYCVGGPYGLCSEFTIELYDDEAELEKDHLQRTGKRLTFRADNAWDVPSKMGVSIIDFSTDTGEYAPRTIGDMNNMNHPSIRCCSELTMGELLSFFHETKPMEVPA